MNLPQSLEAQCKSLEEEVGRARATSALAAAMPGTEAAPGQRPATSPAPGPPQLQADVEKTAATQVINLASIHFEEQHACELCSAHLSLLSHCSVAPHLLVGLSGKMQGCHITRSPLADPTCTQGLATVHVGGACLQAPEQVSAAAELLGGGEEAVPTAQPPKLPDVRAPTLHLAAPWCSFCFWTSSDKFWF